MPLRNYSGLTQFSILLVLVFLCHVPIARGQATANDSSIGSSSRTLITFDASVPVPKVHALEMKMGGVGPGGKDLELNNRYLTLHGKPWLPVMGEFHFSRYPEAGWEEELLKMKAAGVNIVSTYVIWIHHEEIEREFDWSGQRNLRKFVELCAKHGLFVFLRIGPYVHGEVRHGGLPDWLIAEGPVRRNTPEYLSHARQFYGEIGRQLRGLLWKEGGPILGLQLENEYLLHGADAGAAHISMLKQIALECGLDAPLFTVTGWGDADFPGREVLPVHGVYPDAFWESSLQELPPSDAYMFNSRRDAGGIVLDPQGAQHTDEEKLSEYPLLLSEAGGGMQVAYHRRPAIQTADVAAILVTHLGAGANLYGYYMFHGGANPVGKRSTLQESAAIDGVYDLPVVSYDFQAPLGEYGQERASYRTLKLFHFFLNEFGSKLAPMVPVTPDIPPKGPGDRSTPRVALRTDGEHSFFFLNNYLRGYPMAEQKRLQFRVQLKGTAIEFPRRPVDVPPGAYFIWPVNVDLQGVSLRYATAQLVCSVDASGERYYFFFAVPGVPPEFSFAADSVRSIDRVRGNAVRSDRQIYVERVPPGSGVAISVTSRSGKKIHIVVLTSEQTQDLWKVSMAGQERVILSAADAFADGDVLHLQSRDTQRLSFGVFPRLTQAPGSGVPLAETKPDGIFSRFVARVRPRKMTLAWSILRKAEASEPVRKGKYNALAPTDADFDRAGTWSIEIPPLKLSGLSEVFLEIQYRGDVARLYEKQRLLDDDFYRGGGWEVGLERFLAGDGPTKLILRVTPLRKDAPIYLPAGAWPDFGRSEEVAEVGQVSLVPEYEIIVH
jgi:beta-galactosidase